MRVLLVASSSGGHVYPCLSLGKYLKKMNITVKYLGIKSQIEENIYPEKDRYLIDIPKSFKESYLHPIKLFKEYLYLNKLLLKFDVVIGFGGFITYFISMIPNIKKTLFYIHEANVIFGDSNKMCLNKAKKAFTSFKITNNKHYQNKIVLTGNPCVELVKCSKANKGLISFVFGSLGSKTLLNIVIEYLKSQHRNETFLLVTSKKMYETTKEILKEKTNVIVKDYINSKELYCFSKLVFVRGGASTLQEVINTSTNAVVIPSPYVKHDHQRLNAEYLLMQKCVSVVKEVDFTPNKIDYFIDLYSDKNYSLLEIMHQKENVILNPCLNIYLEIINDYKEKL